MKITTKHIKTEATYDSLEIGDTFLWSCSCWLKTKTAVMEATSKPVNAVIIATGAYGYFNDYDKVIPVKTELVLYK